MNELFEIKKYDPRQSRDDHGRWSDGAGGISHGHAAHVMKSEGISDEHAAGVLAKIKDGTHKTREDVLKHIDSIHGGGDSEPHQKTSAEFYSGAATEKARELMVNGKTHHILVFQALSEGKFVPARVLAEYPGIQESVQANKERIADYEVSSQRIRNETARIAQLRVDQASRADQVRREEHAAYTDSIHARLEKAKNAIALNPTGQTHTIAEIAAAMQGLQNPNSGRKMSKRDAEQMAPAVVHSGGIDKVAADETNNVSEKSFFVEVQNVLNTPSKARKSFDDFTDETDEMKTTMNELESMDADDTLVSLGGEIKSLDETESGWKFGGYLVVFDSPDVSNLRDRFTKSTDFDFEDGDTRSIYYNHGLDGTFAKTRIGKGKLFLKDAGVWFEGEVTKRRDYLEKHIERVAEGLKMTVETKGIQAPMYGLSSGALSHLVERERVGDGHVIGKWNLGECSITPCPAEPMTGVCALKSLAESTPEFDEEFDELKYDPDQPRATDGKFGSGGAESDSSRESLTHRLKDIASSHVQDYEDADQRAPKGKVTKIGELKTGDVAAVFVSKRSSQYNARGDEDSPANYHTGVIHAVAPDDTVYLHVGHIVKKFDKREVRKVTVHGHSPDFADTLVKRTAATKSADDFTDETEELKYLSTLETGQSDGGSRFVDHTSRLLDAEDEYLERLHHKALLEQNRKSGGTISTATMSLLKSKRDRMVSILADLNNLIDLHDVQSQMDTEPAANAKKSLDADEMRAAKHRETLRYMALMARGNGVAIEI